MSQKFWKVFQGLCMICNLLIIGCATSPVLINQATQAQSDRILAFQKSMPNYARIIIIRDKGFMGGGCFYAVFIDGRLAARLDTGEKAVFYVPPGEVLLKAGHDPYGKALCTGWGNEWTQRETLMKPFQTKLFRLSIDANGKADIQRAD